MRRFKTKHQQIKHSSSAAAASRALTGRLKVAIARAGGNEAVVEATGMSRAQLFRYLGGTPIPSDRLLQLAADLNVRASWLLGEGSETDSRPALDYKRIRETVERSSTFLQRLTIKPAYQADEFARLVELILLTTEHAIATTGAHTPISDAEIMQGLQFLQHFRTQDWLSVYVDGCAHIARHSPASLVETWASRWVSIVTGAFCAYYTRDPIVTDYYLRLDNPIWDVHLRSMERFVESLDRAFGDRIVRVLDAGCGNGRHLRFLRENRPSIRAKGIDLSPAALQLCRRYERSREFPPRSFRRGNIMSLPFESEEFDAYLSMAMLQYIPLVEGSLRHGVGRVFAEAARVLKPGGLACFLFKSDDPDEFFPVYIAAHNQAHLEELLRIVGLRVVERHEDTHQDTKLPGARNGRGIKQQLLWIAQKT